MATLHKLQNGMEVLLEENHAAPVISFHILVKVGSAMETKEEAGICHLIEHMLFKGTPTRKVGEIAKEVEGAGGEINAYTSFDQTVYFINMAKKFSHKGLDILADAVQNPIFDKTELEREKEVVIEEVRREKDSPAHRVGELLFIKSYKRHPYKNPIIGNEETVRSFTKKEVLNFYRRWYTPENMTFIVVGDFDSTAMLKNIKKAFRRFKGEMPPKIKIPGEPRSKKSLIYTEENPIYATYFAFAFHIPKITDADIPALDVLSHILAGTDSSRLEQVIKEKKQLVNAVYSYAFTPKHPGIFIIGGLTSPDKTTPAITAILDEVHKLHTAPIETNELNRAKLNIRSSEIYEKETTGGQAGKYAYFIATAGTHLFEEEYYRRLQNIHVDDIMRVAQKYLTAENATLIIVPPKGGKNSVNNIKIKSHLSRMKPSRKSAIKVKKHVSPPTMHRLSNGIRIIIRENHTLPIVACTSIVLGGVRFENRENNGINTLLSQVLVKGTKTKNAIQIAEAIEAIAGSIGSSSGRNSFGLKSEFLSDKFNEGFDLFSEVLTQPSFNAEEIAKEKHLQLDAIKNQEDALTALAYIKFLAALFRHHPYGLRTLGSKNSVSKLSRKQLVDYYRRLMDPKNMVVSVVGDISPEEVIKAAEQKLIFPKTKLRAFVGPKAEKSPKEPVTIEYKRAEKEQAHIVMGFLGPRINSKDRYPISVLHNILSGQGGRLFLTLRDKMSLAYAINSSFFAGIEPGYYSIYIGTEPSKIETALDGIKKELNLLLKKGVGKDELNRSKNHIIGSHNLEQQRNTNLSSNYALNVLFGLGLKETEEYPDKINAVTATDVMNVARKYIRMDSPVTAIIRPA